jgi:hypothetical protein
MEKKQVISVCAYCCASPFISSCQKCFPLKYFFSDWQKWELLGAKSGLVGGWARHSQTVYKAAVGGILGCTGHSPSSLLGHGTILKTTTAQRRST